MKLELTVGVYNGCVLVDTVSYVVDSLPIARIFSTLPEDSVDISFAIEGVKELFE